MRRSYMRDASTDSYVPSSLPTREYQLDEVSSQWPDTPMQWDSVEAGDTGRKQLVPSIALSNAGVVARRRLVPQLLFSYG